MLTHFCLYFGTNEISFTKTHVLIIVSEWPTWVGLLVLVWDWECAPPQGFVFNFLWCQFGWANLTSLKKTIIVSEIIIDDWNTINKGMSMTKINVVLIL